MSDEEFYRKSTMCICGSLDLNKALQKALLYLSQWIPADTLFVHLYEEGLGARTLFRATRSEAKFLDRIIPITQDVIEIYKKKGTPNIRIVNRPQHDPIIKRLAEAFDILNTSALVMRLTIEGKRLGSIILTGEGLDLFTEEHRRLFSLLNEPFAIALSNALKHQEVLRLKEMLVDDNRYLNQELRRIAGNEIVGEDFGLRSVMNMVRKVAPLESPVLILGETGVGKGVLASAIHSLSPRGKGPFIAVNSGGIPETLMDSELFGHEKGAFTGATEQRRGRFERADQGTIFLDEIGDLPLPAQVRMLRVLEDKVIERVGGAKSFPVDVRIIAATHHHLDEMVRSNRFRKDLLFRINVFPIHIPPLRERKEDIPSLVRHFIGKKTRELKAGEIPELAPGALDRLIAYDWPGNVRELENVIEREMILYREAPLRFESICINQGVTQTPGEAALFTEGNLTLEKVDRMYILSALKRSNGKIYGPTGAAKHLGLNPSTLRSKMIKLGIIHSH